MLTPRQHQLLSFISQYFQANGYMPSLEEMAKHMVLANRGGVHRILVALEKKKYINRAKHKARGIKILQPVGNA